MESIGDRLGRICKKTETKMRTKKIFDRLNSITMTFVTDTGETITKTVDKIELFELPGLDCIHTVTSAIGHTFGHDIEKWVIDNPKSTSMQEALASGRCEFSRYTHVTHDKRPFIEMCDKEADHYSIIKFEYDNYEDALDDLEYCKKKYEKQ